MKATFKKPEAPNRDYFVPHFGEDEDILSSKEHIAASEKEHKHELKATFDKPKDHPMDYFVPNFGVDHDVITTQNNLGNAEKALNHEWKLSLA